MHGFSSRSALLVNAEVDSMGGVVESGIVVGTKASPRQAAIEKAQAELRLEYDVREERRRELEFLEKGGNPLDFKFGHAASVSVQSTSFTDQHPEQLVNSEAKGSFVLTASPHGDSVESSGRLGVTVACEPNSADNFNGHNELLEGERKSVYSSKVNIPSENSSQLDGGRNAKESEDFPGFYPKKGQAYRRRNRSRTNRDGARSSSTGGHGAVSKAFTSENQVDMELDGARAVSLSAAPMNGDMPGVRGKLDVSTSKDTPDRDQHIKTGEAPVDKTAAQLDFVEGQKHRIRADAEFRPCSVLQNAENNVNTEQPNESIKMKVDEIGTPTEAVNSTMTLVAKGLESKSSCPQTSVSMEGNGNIDSNLGSNLKHVDTKGVSKEQKQAAEQSSSTRDDRMLKEKHVTNGIESVSYSKENQNSILLEQQNDGSTHEDKEDMKEDRSAHNEMASLPLVEESQSINFGAKSEKDPGKGDDSTSKIDNTCPEETRPSGNLCSGEPLVTAGPETCSENQQMLFDKEHEDRVLEEARLIEAKRKRIAELSVGLLPMEHRHKSHWDFVLEEMAWLANDFAQERLWKTTAAAQICHQATFACQSRLEEQTKRWKQRSVTRNIARAVMEFWHSAEQCLKDLDGSSDPDRCTHDKDLSSVHERQGGGRKQLRVLQGYAARFLQHNSSTALPVQAEASVTLDGEVKMDMPELSWQDQFTEENLFYTVPPGAMEAYRKSIESYLADYERTGNNKQGEVDTPMDDAATEFGSQENEYEEDEGESAYYFPGTIKASTSTKYSQKKRKKNLKFYPPRLHELGGDFGYGHSLDNRIVAPNSALLGKRPANSLNVGPIPTKRMRTASRQRVVGPFTIGATGAIPAPTRTDASSGDTNSYQGDHSTLHGGSVVPKGSEVESAMDFDKQSTFDPAEISEKPKKKKKSKHQLYDQRWQLESRMQSEQRDQLRKRLDNHPLESNGSTGLFGQHSKKLKILKQPLESDNLTPVSGSVPSPVASQMSNMSNQTKVIKFIGGRDRGRKAKALKVSAGQSISGSPWSLFEDQALVVLVHDMGPNWELVSDAINSTLQFKCIFRKPQECKERHKILMDRTSGDGADSAEDSGSSQPYPSTLPGIPKGSARQLFQRLQGPVEEDTIKSHFEKIILIGRQMHYRKKQNDNQDIKQIAPVHGSHVLALSQVIPNNVNGGVLTPLDFYDDSNQDVVSIGYQGPHTGGLQLSSSVAVPPVHPAAGSSSSLQVGPGMSGGNNNASPSAQLNGSLRDSRYGAPRAGSLPPDEQQRIQQYNQMLSGRNVQQPNFAGAGALSTMDRGVRMLPGGDGGGVMPGIKRNTQMRRPGIQGVTSSSMLNSGIMVGMPNSMNMHSGAGQGNSMFRSRDALHMVRPGQNPEHQRQMSLPDMQMQATQAASQGVPSFSGFSSALPSQSTLPSVQAYPVHHQMPQQHSHVLSSHHPHLQGSSHPSPTESQAYVQLARERQIQRQRLLQRQQQQQHQQVPVSSAVMSHIQTQPQLPISSSLQNSSQIRSQTPSNPVSVTPSTPSSPLTSVSSSQQQQKNQVPPSSGLGRSAQSSAGGIVNPVEKQRQRQTQQIQQQLQQTSRQHPLQRQPLQSQHQAKLLKGMGRGNMPMHQNLSPDPSHLNGFSASSGSQVTEKGDPTMHLMQGQGLYPGSGMNIVQSSKPLVSQPQKSYSIPASASSKQVPLRPDSSSQGPAAPATNLGVPTSVMPSVNHQQQGQPQPSLKLLNQAQTVRRAVQQNRQVNTDVEQQFVSSNSLRGATSGIPSVSVESTNVMALSSCSGDSYRKDRESLCSPSIGNTSGNEPLPSVSQGLGQRQSSGSLQWQQQQSQHKQAPPVQLREPQQQQLEQSPQRQLPPQQ